MDCPLRLKSASNAWPIASCRRMPDAPAPITTLICPPAGLRASNIASIPLVASAATASMSSSVKNSAPILKLRDALLVWTEPPDM